MCNCDLKILSRNSMFLSNLVEHLNYVLTVSNAFKIQRKYVKEIRDDRRLNKNRRKLHPFSITCWLKIHKA